MIRPLPPKNSTLGDFLDICLKFPSQFDQKSSHKVLNIDNKSILMPTSFDEIDLHFKEIYTRGHLDLFGQVVRLKFVH